MQVSNTYAIITSVLGCFGIIWCHALELQHDHGAACITVPDSLKCKLFLLQSTLTKPDQAAAVLMTRLCVCWEREVRNILLALQGRGLEGKSENKQVGTG